MTMNVTRRAVLGFGSGAAVGLALSPAPWKLIDDLGIWTQNWKWIPRPPHGPVTIRTTSCSLCPAGCAVQARCVGGHPVAMKAAANDTAGAAALCPLGQTGHHLRYHPARLTSPARVSRRNGVHADPVAIGLAVAETAKALRRNGTVAVLDMRPGRSVSWGWRRLMADVPEGVVIDAPGREGSSLTAVRGMLQGDAPAVGVDLEHARAILSFGAPLAEGWGSPHFTAKLLRRGKGELHLVQVEPTRTRTAELADRWLAARPGTEGVLALGIGHVLLAEGLATADAVRAASDLNDYVSLVARFTPAAVETITGVPAQSIALAAREVAARLPAVVLAGEDPGGGRFDAATETAILGLNGLLGIVGQQGGLVTRALLPEPSSEERLAEVRELHEIRDRSVSLLLIDSSAGETVVPWPLIARKLASSSARVVVMSPYLAGLALHADLVVPTAPFLEGILEVPGGFDAVRPSLALAGTIGEPREGNVDPVEFLTKAFAAASLPLPAWTRSEELIRARVAAIHAAGDGEIVTPADGSVTPLGEIASADDLWAALTGGARWQGSAIAAAPLRWKLLGGSSDELAKLATPAGNESLTLVLRASRDAAASAAVSPYLAKLYQESALRRSAGTAAVNPLTARQLGLRAGRLARLETGAGSVDVLVATDTAVMPKVVEVTVGPDAAALGDGRRAGHAGVLDILSPGANGVWRSGPAKLVEA